MNAEKPILRLCRRKRRPDPYGDLLEAESMGRLARACMKGLPKKTGATFATANRS